jgi:hypothetical protein
VAWLLRIGALRNWRDKNPERAARDLTLRLGETGLSVFRVEGPDDAEVVVTLASICHREKPREVEYVLIPEGALEALAMLRVSHRPNHEVPALLGNCHYEIEGMRELADAALVLARAVVDVAQPNRLREREVISIASRLAEVPEVLEFLNKPSRDEWRRVLEEWTHRAKGGG